MTLYIRPYKRGSASAKLLRAALGISNLSPRTTLQEGDVIMNWGGQDDMPSSFNEDTMTVLNRPEAIRRSVSKVEFLSSLGGLTQYFTNRDALEDAYPTFPAGMVVYCRTLTRASKGRGIIIATKQSEIVNAPLYTIGYPCKREYRVHVFNGRIIDLVAKVRVTNPESPKYRETPDPYIRNSETGYVFARNSVKIPESARAELQSLAVHAVRCCGLTFGAVDIVRDIRNQFTTLEVNSAPGIMGSALESLCI